MNDTKVPAEIIMPEAWLEHVESLLFTSHVGSHPGGVDQYLRDERDERDDVWYGLFVSEPSPYLTPADAAKELDMTADGVRKLVRNGKLKAIKVSERRIVISRAALIAYRRRINGEALSVPELPPVADLPSLIESFERSAGCSAAVWLQRWKADQIEDSAANMALMMQASAIRSAELAAGSVPRRSTSATRTSHPVS